MLQLKTTVLKDLLVNKIPAVDITLEADYTPLKQRDMNHENLKPVNNFFICPTGLTPKLQHLKNYPMLCDQHHIESCPMHARCEYSLVFAHFICCTSPSF